ncbi:hypothetical protein [Halorubellus sp. PRR65]|nr:hypothetical protein [Halorubellus sp. PRR65]
MDVETHTIISHRAFEEMFDAARTYDADVCVRRWGRTRTAAPNPESTN